MFNHVLIIADIEGSSGCPDYAASSFMTPGWPAACLEMTRDVNAVASALLDAGVRVTIHDFHRTGYNLIGGRIDSRAKLVQAFLPLGLLLYRIVGITGLTWVKARLRSRKTPVC